MAKRLTTNTVAEVRSEAPHLRMRAMWRIRAFLEALRWQSGDAHDVRIVDYH